MWLLKVRFFIICLYGFYRVFSYIFTKCIKGLVLIPVWCKCAPIFQNWKRYLDDCLILWPGTEEDMDKLKSIINNIHPDIQFTSESSQTELPFLDILIKKGNMGTTIETDIYYKPTDSKQYLLFNSCHPKHVRTNVPYNLARRICTIVSNEQTKLKRLNELKSFLEQRLFPSGLIKAGIRKAYEEKQEDLQQSKQQTSQNIITFTTTFNPRNPDIFTIIKPNLAILQNDDKMKNVLQKNPIIKSHRQLKNLKKLITRAKFQEKQNDIPPTISKCGRSNCGICDILVEGESFKFKNGPLFKVKINMDCSSKNLLYVIKCEGCEENYIGQTGNDLRKRMTVHRQQIKDPSTRKIPLSAHLSECAGNKDNYFTLFPFYKFPINATEQHRIIKEAEFIKNTSLN